MVGSVPQNIAIFTMCETLRRQLTVYYPNMSKENKSLIAGSLAAGVSVLVMSPLELLKVVA